MVGCVDVDVLSLQQNIGASELREEIQQRRLYCGVSDHSGGQHSHGHNQERQESSGHWPAGS